MRQRQERAGSFRAHHLVARLHGRSCRHDEKAPQRTMNCATMPCPSCGRWSPGSIARQTMLQVPGTSVTSITMDPPGGRSVVPPVGMTGDGPCRVLTQVMKSRVVLPGRSRERMTSCVRVPARTGVARRPLIPAQRWQARTARCSTTGGLAFSHAPAATLCRAPRRRAGWPPESWRTTPCRTARTSARDRA